MIRMQKVIQIYKKIVHTGTNKKFSDINNKYTKLVNIYVLICLHASLVFYISDLIFLDKPLTAHITAYISQLQLIIILILNQKHYFNAAKLLWIAYLFIYINISTCTVNPGIYTEYYFLLVPGICLAIYQKNTIPIIATLLGYFCFFAPYYFWDIYPENHPNKTQFIVVGVLFYCVYAIINYFKKLNAKNEAKLLVAYEELEKRKKLEIADLQLQSLKSQMNPHFIFNALNSIQEYIILNQKRLASDYLGKFADLIRAYLNHSMKDAIALKEEIACLEMYLELEKLRFEDTLSYCINYKHHQSLERIMIPTMLIQPYVENALKHGLLHRKNNRILSIDFDINVQTKMVVCTIIDNGVGRKKSEEYKAKKLRKHTSFASKANENRLQLINMNMEKERQAKIIITDLYEKDKASGTKVVLTIPYL